MTKYNVREDYKKLNIYVPMIKPLFPLMRYATRKLYDMQKIKSGINHKKLSITGYKEYQIPIEIFSPMECDEKAPCLLFIHGGAFALPATDFHKKLICDYILAINCRIVFVDYRLAPKYPFPYGIEDCYSAYKWIIDNADISGFDLNKIAIYGDSAGGALAASLTQIIRDRILQPPLFQALIYPVVDSRMETESMKQFVDTPIWNQKLNKKMWRFYLGSQTNARYEYASPMAAKSFSDLPQAYIEVNEFDCLRDEAIEYYKKLKSSGVNAVINQLQGTIHGFELNYESAYTQSVINDRINYMKEKFKN